jgi:hypothetical protein
LARGSPSYAVEEALSRIETGMGPALSGMIETQTLVKDREQRWLFAKFMATLLVRTRQGLQSIHNWRNAMQVEGAYPAEDPLFDLDDEGVRELFAKAAISLAEPLATTLNSLYWTLVRARDAYFVSSENPLVVHHSGPGRWSIGTPGAHIHLPLSPQLLLHLSSQEYAGTGSDPFDLSASGVDGLNGLTVLSAEQYLFSHKTLEGSDLLKDRPPGSRREFGPGRVSPRPSDATTLTEIRAHRRSRP